MTSIKTILNILPTVAFFVATAFLLAIGTVYEMIEAFMAKHSRKIQENVKMPKINSERRFYKKPALY
jgi:hypothetical protein